MTTETTNERDMQLNVLDSGIACLSIDVRGSKVNTLGTRSMSELAELLDQVKKDPKVKALIISSGKHDSFIAGADVK